MSKMINNAYVCGDAFPYLAQMPDKSVDLIFTSLPDLSQTPYSRLEVSLYKGLQKQACEEFARLVTDKGFIVTCQTDRRLNAEMLCNHVWYIQCLTELGLKVKDEKIVVRNEVGRKDLYYMTYQYMTIFSRHGGWKREGEFLRDIIVDKQKLIEGQSTWSFDFCKLVIESLTKPGQLVIDPFAAAGPVLYAAMKLDRRWWGAEITPERYNTGFTLFQSEPSLDLF
jgi:DNA methylase